MNSSLREAGRHLVLIVGLAYVPFLGAHALCLAGFGWGIAGVELVVYVPVFATLAFPVALICFAFRRLRARALYVASLSASLIVLFLLVARAGTALRRHGFELAADRAAPLVHAIGEFQQDRGAPPSDLDELIPGYLAELPADIPQFELITGDEAAKRFAGNEWALVAVCPTGFLNWDLFLYFPDQNYPERGYGGWIEPIADWAYVHE